MLGKNKNGAFDCDNCPKSNDASGKRWCPAWWETIETNADGEIKTTKACGWTQIPRYMIEVIKASNRPAAAVESTRNEIANGFSRLAELAEKGPLLIGKN